MKCLILLSAAVVTCTALVPHYSSRGLFQESVKSNGIHYCLPDRVKIPYVGQMVGTSECGQTQALDLQMIEYADFDKQKEFIRLEVTQESGKKLISHVLNDYKKEILYIYQPSQKRCTTYAVKVKPLQCLPDDNKIIANYTDPDGNKAVVVRFEQSDYLSMINGNGTNEPIRLTGVFKRVDEDLTPFSVTVDVKITSQSSLFTVLMYGEMSTEFSDDVFNIPDYC